MLNGANGAAIFKANGEVEVIQFRTVVTNADGTFTISNLLRGRRGTDTMAYNHTAFETFVFLEVNDIEVMQLSLGERNSALTYRAVGTGQLFDNGETQVFTSLHRALMPYAPVHATMADGASSSTDFAWVRRTRVGGAWQDSVGEVPLSEDSEEYELEIFDRVLSSSEIEAIHDAGSYGKCRTFVEPNMVNVNAKPNKDIANKKLTVLDLPDFDTFDVLYNGY